MKLLRCISLSVVILICFPVLVLASGFQLKTVGALNVDGVTYDQLWYTNGSVTFTGIATAGAEVTATIDGTSATTTADASGNWSYSTTLSDGDHSVSFVSSGSTIALTLTIGELPEGVGALPSADTPTAGTSWPTVLLIGAGVVLVSWALYLRRGYLRS